MKRCLSCNKQLVGGLASFWSKAKLDDLDVHSSNPLEPCDEVERFFTGEEKMTPYEWNPLEKVGKAILDNKP